MDSILVVITLCVLVFAGWLFGFIVLGALWGSVRFCRRRFIASKHRKKVVALLKFWFAEMRWQIHQLIRRNKSKNGGFRQYLNGDGELSDELVALLGDPSSRAERSLDDLLD